MYRFRNHDSHSKVISLTGRSEDDVALALHDCDYDTNSAVNKLLEEAGSHDVSTYALEYEFIFTLPRMLGKNLVRRRRRNKESQHQAKKWT